MLPDKLVKNYVFVDRAELIACADLYRQKEIKLKELRRLLRDFEREARRNWSNKVKFESPAPSGVRLIKIPRPMLRLMYDKLTGSQICTVIIAITRRMHNNLLRLKQKLVYETFGYHRSTVYRALKRCRHFIRRCFQGNRVTLIKKYGTLYWIDSGMEYTKMQHLDNKHLDIAEEAATKYAFNNCTDIWQLLRETIKANAYLQGRLRGKKTDSQTPVQTVETRPLPPALKNSYEELLEQVQLLREHNKAETKKKTAAAASFGFKDEEERARYQEFKMSLFRRGKNEADNGQDPTHEGKELQGVQPSGDRP